MSYFVYILQCRDGSLYTGSTIDLDRRFNQHKEGKGARYTRAKGASQVLYVEMLPSRTAALRREAEIKSWRREKKLRLVGTMRQKRRKFLLP